jgi:hypothetical protein
VALPSGRGLILLFCLLWRQIKKAPTESGLQVRGVRPAPLQAGEQLKCTGSPVPSPGPLVGVQTARVRSEWSKSRFPVLSQALACPASSLRALAFSAGGEGGRKQVRLRIANAKILGWLIYVAGFAIWLFGYLSPGHAAVFDWHAATPWWISSFVPNLEAELGMALMFATMIPIYGRAIRGNSARIFACVALLVFASVTLAWWGFLGWLIWRVI